MLRYDSFGPAINIWSLHFGEKNIKKSKFYKSKNVFKIYDIDANKILVPKEKPHGSYIWYVTLML